MIRAHLLFACVALLASGCRPSSDRTEAQEAGAAASGGSAQSRSVGDPVQPGANQITPETLPAAPAIEDTAEPLADNPAANAVDTPPAATPAIPQRYQGRWGMVAADCTSTQGDAKGLLTINDRTLRFYESTGTLAEQLPAIATSFSGRFAFTGEGMAWQRVVTLTLSGDTLTRADETGTFTYSRCAA